MATTTFIPIETYLRMESEPDCEYVDAQIEERPAAEFDHSSWQGALLAFFAGRRSEWQVRALPSLRTRVSVTRIRVPDVAVPARWIWYAAASLDITDQLIKDYNAQSGRATTSPASTPAHSGSTKPSQSLPGSPTPKPQP
jgi:hypothetical protein